MNRERCGFKPGARLDRKMIETSYDSHKLNCDQLVDVTRCAIW